MRFSERFRQIVGTLNEPGANPIGTFFVIQEEMNGWLDEPERDVVRWMVTARHVIHEKPNIEATMKNSRGTVVRWDVSEGWLSPWMDRKLTQEDPGFDLAVRLFDPSRDTRPFFALPTGLSVTATGRKIDETGRPVYFVGLLAIPAWKHSEIEPVVRGGSVAAIEVEDFKWSTNEDLWWWTAGNTQLIDIRSVGGFSGSPVFVQFYIPSTQKNDWPPIWHRMANYSKKDIEQLGALETFTHWWGMFVAHAKKSGIGAVIRDVDIVDFLATSEVLAVKAAEERRINEKRDDDRPNV